MDRRPPPEQAGRSRTKPLSDDEIQAAMAEIPAVLSPHQLADVLGLSVKTIYEWLQRNRLDGTFTKRGKHVRFWRNRVLKLIFNGPEWESNEPD